MGSDMLARGLISRWHPWYKTASLRLRATVPAWRPCADLRLPAGCQQSSFVLLARFKFRKKAINTARLSIYLQRHTMRLLWGWLVHQTPNARTHVPGIYYRE